MIPHLFIVVRAGNKHQSEDNLTLAISSSLTAQRGGGATPPPPWRFQSKHRRALRKKSAYSFSWVLAIGGTFFDPRSKFDPVMGGQRPNFPEISIFSDLRVHISKTIQRIEMKPLSLKLRSILSRMTYCFGILIKYLLCIASRKEITSLSPGKSPDGKLGERP